MPTGENDLRRIERQWVMKENQEFFSGDKTIFSVSFCPASFFPASIFYKKLTLKN